MSRHYRSDGELEALVINLVNRARTEFGLAEGITADRTCTVLGLQVKRGQLPEGVDGLLRGQTVITSTALNYAPRVEYTIFHEIMHFLLERDGELYDYLTDVLAHNQVAFDAAIERWCQLGAAEFLLPSRRVRDLIAREGFSIRLVSLISAEFGASLLASAIQLAACAPVDCYVAVCRHGASPNWPHQPSLYVEQAIRHLGAQYPIARGTTIPDDHLFRAAWDTQLEQSGPAYIPFRSGKRFPCRHGEACRVGNQVVGVLYLGAIAHAGQLALDM